MTPASVLIVQLGRIGDFILTTPMFRAIKQALPSTTLHVLIGPQNEEIASAHPSIDEVHVLQTGVLGMISGVMTLRRRVEVLIDPKDHFSRQSVFVSRFANCGRSVGFNRPGKSSAFDVGATFGSDAHVARRNLHVLEAIGIHDDNARPVLFANRTHDAKVLEWLGERGIGSFVCINISVGDASRWWSVEKWKVFVQETASAERRAVVLSAPGDQRDAVEIASVSPFATAFSSPSMLDVMSLVSRAAIVVSPDTSIIHVAAAFDRPVLGLYPEVEWNLARFAPLSSAARVVRSSSSSLMGIGVDRVLNAFVELAALTE